MQKRKMFRYGIGSRVLKKHEPLYMERGYAKDMEHVRKLVECYVGRELWIATARKRFIEDKNTCCPLQKSLSRQRWDGIAKCST